MNVTIIKNNARDIGKIQILNFLINLKKWLSRFSSETLVEIVHALIRSFFEPIAVMQYPKLSPMKATAEKFVNESALEVM